MRPDHEPQRRIVDALPPRQRPLTSTNAADAMPLAQVVRVPALVSRKTLALAGLALALVTVLIVTLVVLAQPDAAPRATHPTPVPAATRLPTGTPPPTDTPQPGQIPTNAPGVGWVNEPAAAWAQAIAFAPSDATTAYACGPSQVGTHSSARASGPTAQPYSVGASRDGGHTWALVNLTFTGASTCALSISPSNPQAVVLLISHLTGKGCAPCNNSSDAYRSSDGGHTWGQLQLPVDPTNTVTGIVAVAWAGAALLATSDANTITQPTSGVPPVLALFAPTGAAQWIDKRVVPDPQSGATIFNVFDASTAAYVELTLPRTNDNINPHAALLATRDGGVTWHAQDEQTYGIFSASTDGHTIYGLSGENTIARSIDGGATWLALPPLPDLLQGQTCFDVPDATLYCPVVGATGTPSGIVSLAPGSTQWRYVGALPQVVAALAVQPDAAGHAVRLWGGVSDSDPSAYGVGLQTHAATAG